MKPLYLIFIATTCALSANAQSGRFTKRTLSKGFNPGTMSGTVRPPVHPTAASGSGQRNAFYTEDFSSGGLPAGWTTTDAMTPSGQTPVLFQWSNDPASVTSAAVNQSLILTFNAPGASNGYLWANSDRGLTATPTSNHLTQLTTTSIDCSAALPYC